MELETTNSKKRDWILYGLVLAAVMTLPLSIEQTSWAPGAKGLIYVAFFGSLLGVFLARSPVPAWLSWLVSLLLGAQYSLQYTGKLLPSASALFRDAGQAVAWVWQAVRYGAIGSSLPFSETAGHLARQFALMTANTSQWLQAVQAGSPTKDTTVLVLGVCFVTWMLAWHTAYELFRGRRTFVGLLPLGAAVVANVSFTDIGMAYVNVYLFVTMLILVWSNAGRMETVWARLGLDFSPELKRDVLVTGSTISALILVVALVMPYFVYARAIFWFWDRYGTGITSFYDRLDIAFAGRNPVPEPTARPKGLAEHAVGSGGGGSLGSSTVFSVVTSDPPPPTQEEMEMWGEVDIYQWVAKHYWRERTYDVYTGHGWDTSERQNTSRPANAPWNEISYPHTILTQTYTIRNPGGDLAFGVNEPVSVDRTYRTLTRGQDDLAALLLTAPQYTVVSAIPDVTVEALREDEGEYPSWVQERYLPLPRIPSRVQQKAEEVVREAGATTRFDKARAIELYLRMFPYDLELEPPPLDQDVVDYFLFTAERGYCDYSASAMVVMLRAVGVAARYASGYAMGEYDHYANAWVVTEKDAHAWAEVYFPEYGWIEFEPTPAQATFSRFSSSSGWNLNQPFSLETPNTQRISPLWIGGGTLLLVVLFVIVWPPRWFRGRGLPSRERILRVYERLVKRVRWLGLSPWPGQTVRQYMHYLVQQIELRTPSAYGAREDVMLIMSTYERARYSDAPLNEEEYYRVEAAWRRLRGPLMRLLFTRAPSFEARQPSLVGDLSAG